MQGFKIELLLKLEDIKATDRKTSLLQFCIQQAEDKSESVLNLAEDLAVVKQAARLQVQTPFQRPLQLELRCRIP